MPQAFVLTTDHGTHPADSWADMISQLIFPISDEIAQHRRLPAKNAQLAIANAIVEHAQAILDHEHEHLDTDPDARFEAEHDGHLFVDDAMELIHSVTDKTEWAQHMHDQEDVIRAELERHFNSMQNVERMHHSDHNPSDAGDAYKRKFHPVMGV